MSGEGCAGKAGLAAARYLEEHRTGQMKERFNYLFGSTKGLILVALSMVGIVTAIWGMLSGPMAEMGVREVVIKALGMKIIQSEREGRIIILYHSIAMAIIAI